MPTMYQSRKTWRRYTRRTLVVGGPWITASAWATSQQGLDDDHGFESGFPVDYGDRGQCPRISLIPINIYRQGPWLSSHNLTNLMNSDRSYSFSGDLSVFRINLITRPLPSGLCLGRIDLERVFPGLLPSRASEWSCNRRHRI